MIDNNIAAFLFSDNTNSINYRSQVIKNQINISEDNQNLLEKFFFSNENIDLINKLLILTIFKKSGGDILIAPQSNESLIIVMRYIFIEYAKHLPYNIKNQILELNYKVVNDIIPNIITNITQKIEYLNILDKPRELVPLPINVNKNNKNLPSVI